MTDILNIREWRYRRAYSLQELADEVGVKLQTLWNWEVGKARPTPSNRRKLAKALGVSVEQIEWDRAATPTPKSRAA